MVVTIPKKEIDIISYKSKEEYNPEKITETQGFAKRFPKVKDRVLSILKNDKLARKKDWYLTILYWAKCGYIDIMIPKEKLTKITSPESITRARRKIMEEARNGEESLKYLLDDEIDEMRFNREKEIREYFSNENPL